MPDEIIRDDALEEVEDIKKTDNVSKKKSFNLIGLVGIIIAVIVMSAAAFFLSKLLVRGFIQPKTNAVENISTKLSDEDLPESKSDQVGNEPVSVKYIVEIKDMVINPQGSFGTHFLSLNVGIGFNSSNLMDEMESNKIQIKDKIISIMSAFPVEVLSDIRYRESLKKQLLKGINEILTKGKVQSIYFTEFVLQ